MLFKNHFEKEEQSSLNLVLLLAEDIQTGDQTKSVQKGGIKFKSMAFYENKKAIIGYVYHKFISKSVDFRHE